MQECCTLADLPTAGPRPSAAQRQERVGAHGGAGGRVGARTRRALQHRAEHGDQQVVLEQALGGRLHVLCARAPRMPGARQGSQPLRAMSPRRARLIDAAAGWPARHRPGGCARAHANTNRCTTAGPHDCDPRGWDHELEGGSRGRGEGPRASSTGHGAPKEGRTGCRAGECPAVGTWRADSCRGGRHADCQALPCSAACLSISRAGGRGARAFSLPSVASLMLLIPSSRVAIMLLSSSSKRRLRAHEPRHLEAV